MPDRLSILRSGLNKTDRLIEIGPSYNPVAPKRDGWGVWSIDHASQADLIEKYRVHPSVDTKLIERVDFVWTKGSLSDAVPPELHHTFDVFIASHVIEHTPDLVGFFRSAEALTHDRGRMILAVPDKRVCFDFFRPVSTTGDALAAHHEGRSRHTRKTLFDYFAYQSTKHGQPGWDRRDREEPTFVYTLEDAAAQSEQEASAEYLDAHNWVFVPSSLALIVLELARLGLTDWEVERMEPASATEFYMWLRRGGTDRAHAATHAEFAGRRLDLLNGILLDLEEQAVQLRSIASRTGHASGSGDREGSTRILRRTSFVSTTLGSLRPFGSLTRRSWRRLRKLGLHFR